MDEKTRQNLLWHFAQYPGMEAQDCIKLLFQGELGGGHLITDEAAFVQALVQEMALPGLLAEGKTLPQLVGGGLCRVHLGSLGLGLSAQTLAVLCMLSARDVQGNETNLRKKIKALQNMIVCGELPLPQSAAAEVAQALAQTPLQQPHHSERYRALYNPHYRLLRADIVLFLPVFAAVDAALATRSHVLLGIDGMCASGKSTLAGLLAQVYACGLVHTDDFFLQPSQRSAQRLQEPGGNVEYERLAPVAEQAARGGAFHYPVYNCALGRLEGSRVVPPARLTVLEGAYALHPKVKAQCDVRVFLSVDANVQAQRILERNGEEMAGRFASQWIPMENRYFNAFRVREGCDVVVDTTTLE